MSALPDMRYNFSKLGDSLAEVLNKAAADHVAEALKMQKETNELAEAIKARVDKHADVINDMHARLQTFGRTVVDAHKVFVNGEKDEPHEPG